MAMESGTLADLNGPGSPPSAGLVDALPAGGGPAADDDSIRVPIAAWYGLAVLLMTTLFAFVVRQMLSLIAPSLQTSLGFTDFQIPWPRTPEAHAVMRQVANEVIPRLR